MKKLLVAVFSLLAMADAVALEGKFGTGWYEFASSEKNTKAEERPMSAYKGGSIVFFRNDTAYMFYPQKHLDLDSLVVCPELMKLNIEGTFAYDENSKKIYFVKKAEADNMTQIFEATQDEKGEFGSVKLLKIKGAMAEKNQMVGSTLTMGRYNFSHPGVKGFHNLSLAKNGTRIYFSGDFKAGVGGRDIYYIDKEAKEEGVWSRPILVGDSVNSKYTEDYPILVGDTALYFASNRPGGMGDFDLYGAHKLRFKDNFEDPILLSDVFNSEAADYNIAYNKRAMYFISKRSGGSGKADIYYPARFEFAREPELQMHPTLEEPKGFNWVLFFFDFGATDSKPEYEIQLNELYEAMQEFPGFTFEISGHTDSRGSAEFNQKLSQKRADYIRQLLIQRGMNPKKIKAVGRGLYEPIVKDAQTEEEHEQNRRVEVKLLDD